MKIKINTKPILIERLETLYQDKLTDINNTDKYIENLEKIRIHKILELGGIYGYMQIVKEDK